jgi:hypothetical protein
MRSTLGQEFHAVDSAIWTVARMGPIGAVASLAVLL